jgi:hypothetical protein
LVLGIASLELEGDVLSQGSFQRGMTFPGTGPGAIGLAGMTGLELAHGVLSGSHAFRRAASRSR